MQLKQFKVKIKDSDGKKHKFTYRAETEDEVVRKVKIIIPNCSILSVDPV